MISCLEAAVAMSIYCNGKTRVRAWSSWNGMALAARAGLVWDCLAGLGPAGEAWAGWRGIRTWKGRCQAC